MGNLENYVVSGRACQQWLEQLSDEERQLVELRAVCDSDSEVARHFGIFDKTGIKRMIERLNRLKQALVAFLYADEDQDA